MPWNPTPIFPVFIENGHVIRLIGTEINYIKNNAVFESDFVQERERPHKSNERKFPPF